MEEGHIARPQDPDKRLRGQDGCHPIGQGQGRQIAPGRKGVKCAGMEGLLKEGDELLKDKLTDDVRDAGMIAAAQKVEHYEIAAYGTLCAYARQLGKDDALSLLEETLEEEKETDRKLTELAESSVNLEAETSADD